MKLQDFQSPATPKIAVGTSKMEEIRRKANAAKEADVSSPLEQFFEEPEGQASATSNNHDTETSTELEEVSGEASMRSKPSAKKGTVRKSLEDVPVNLLQYYPAHPFKLYEGKRLDEMVQSIQDVGIMNPIIVTPNANGYIILSGHNRVQAAKIAGLSFVPALVQHNLSDAQKKLIVVESNLHQRAVSEMTATEKGYAYKMELEALKELGKTSEKVNKFSTFQQAETLDVERVEELGCACATGGKIKEQMAETYDTTYDEIYRYVRLTFLVPELQQRVDAEALGLTVAVPLSYISHPLQQQIYVQLEAGKQVDREKAELLKRYFKQKKLSDETIRQILNGELSTSTKKSKTFSVSLKPQILKSYFSPNLGQREIQKEVVNSLELTQKLIPSLLEQHGINESPERVVQKALDFYFELRRRDDK